MVDPLNTKRTERALTQLYRSCITEGLEMSFDEAVREQEWSLKYDEDGPVLIVEEGDSRVEFGLQGYRGPDSPRWSGSGIRRINPAREPRSRLFGFRTGFGPTFRLEKMA